MIASTFIIKNGSEDYGPFETAEAAEEWGNKQGEWLGDWYVTDLYTPEDLDD